MTSQPFTTEHQPAPRNERWGYVLDAQQALWEYERGLITAEEVYAAHGEVPWLGFAVADLDAEQLAAARAVVAQAPVDRRVQTADGKRHGLLIAITATGGAKVRFDDRKIASWVWLSDLITEAAAPAPAPAPFTGDDLLSTLPDVDQDSRAEHLAGYSIRLLRDAADLCGVDIAGLGRAGLIKSILENF
jgi:hypothetical protein